ncbi:MAG: N-acetyltransferase [Chloroflexi bacterium]|nr:MAG: N-acetyltransferase [Chloroflexota bacterium]
MAFYLETSRLILRSFEEKDTQPFSEYRSDPEIAKYQGWNIPFTIMQAVDFVNEMKLVTPGEPGHWYQIAIELKTHNQMIGDCAFHRSAEDPAQAEIGFTLAHDFQGKGFGTEAVSRLLKYLFVDLDLHRVKAGCDPNNTASKKLLEKVGMRHEGRFIESYWLKGEWVSEDWYALLKREWVSRHQFENERWR